jgi:molybdate transport system ATP-binding protein
MLDVALETHFETFQLNLAFKAQAGQTTVLLGESGAGKSTVLRLLAGLQTPHKGHIMLDGMTYFDSIQHIAIPPQRRPFGYVFQDYVLFPHLSVYENVAFGLRAQHLARQIIHQRVTEVLERVNLTEFEQRLPSQISGGQQQRVAIARALALRPQLLLLDEPLAALDVQTRREVRQELRHILRDIGVTTLLVTHQYLDAVLFGDQILVLDQGQLIQQGEQRELHEHPRSSYIAELVGVNFFRGQIESSEDTTTCTIRLHNPTSDGQPTEIVALIEEKGEQAAFQSSKGQEACVIVDPRSITLHQSAPEGSARNVFRGEVAQVLRLGGSTSEHDGQIRVSILLNQNEAPLTAEITQASATRMNIREGQMIFATFKASEANAYL